MGWFKKTSDNSYDFEKGVEDFHKSPGTEVVEGSGNVEFRTKRIQGHTVRLTPVVNPDMIISGGFDATSLEKAVTIIFKKPYDQVMLTLETIEPFANQLLDMKRRLELVNPVEELSKIKENK